ncbi:Nucleoside-diphosphate-sugar epimerase [Geosmithia morbida]|uniref:Nucleoside-diphosphate-sugar epimerase n=1 Tax=Geosmithia morbida TaxID=1094350 RepID=A0A9P5D8M7_9HYPO|nr:Nucleoside-diphosphate-sugar epimerase [Geosmithia morbida]KAF4126950.1 Nucleoside-diphosphate-sugar epimerase [Geosmithia morbida]
MSPTPTILIAGATGNTGQNAVRRLSEKLDGSPLAGHRILALTRSAKNKTAQELSQLRHVEVLEKNWIDVSVEWLREQGVTRAFIAPHTGPSHFPDETGFHVSLRDAGVKYVVRISTTAQNVRPDAPAAYPRTHWAIDAVLESSGFQAKGELAWTTLHPNIFTHMVAGPAVQYVAAYAGGDHTTPLRLVIDRDAPVAYILPAEVGTVAAHLLLQTDSVLRSEHNGKRYVLNGPEDVTGQQVVDLIEAAIGAKVPGVVYRDASLMDPLLVEYAEEHRNVAESAKRALETWWDGAATTDSTSKEVFGFPEDVIPKTKFEQTFKEYLGQ